MQPWPPEQPYMAPYWVESQAWPPSPPRRTLWQRFHNAPVAARLGIGGGVGCSVLFCACILFSCGAPAFQMITPWPEDPAVATQFASYHPPITMPSGGAPLPIATAIAPGPQPLSGAVLGGSPLAFERRYGSAPFGSLATQYATSGSMEYTTPAGYNVRLSVDAFVGSDGQLHITYIAFAPSEHGDTWSIPAAQAIAAAYFPPDAVHLANIQTSTNHSSIYYSARLGATFPAGVFTHASGTTLVRPGTFFYDCFALEDDSGSVLSVDWVNTCYMGPGQP